MRRLQHFRHCHKNLTSSILIFLLGFLYLWPLWQYPFFETHDGLLHGFRLGAFLKTLSSGQFLPRWAADLANGFGYPVFIFNYPLPYYIGSLFYFLGFSIEGALKLVFALSFVFAGIFFYLLLREVFDSRTSFIGALFYMLAPYHFLDLYVRGALGELVCLSLVPLIFYFGVKIFRKRKREDFLGLAFSSALVILSHNALGLIFIFSFLIFISIISIVQKNLEKFLVVLSALFLGLCLSSFFWLPALYEIRFTHMDVFINDMYKENFPYLSQLIFSPWGFTDRHYKKGGLSPQIGPWHTLMVLIFLLHFLGLREKRNNPVSLSLLLLFFLSLILMLKAFSPIWQYLSLLKKIQFPWRFLSLAIFTSSFFASYIFSKIRNSLISFLLAIGFLASSFYYVGVKRPIHFDDSYYFQYEGTATWQNELNPIWIAEIPEKVEDRVLLIEGKGSIIAQDIQPTVHSLIISAMEEVRILDNTFYFPGWRVLIDNQKVPIEFQDSRFRGLITFKVPRGKHEVKVVFGRSLIRLFAEFISTSSLLFFTFVLVQQKKIKGFFKLIIRKIK